MIGDGESGRFIDCAELSADPLQVFCVRGSGGINAATGPWPRAALAARRRWRALTRRARAGSTTSSAARATALHRVGEFSPEKDLPRRPSKTWVPQSHDPALERRRSVAFHCRDRRSDCNYLGTTPRCLDQHHLVCKQLLPTRKEFPRILVATVV